ncbi:hypothetical protein GCM10022393_42480 [Aquimarina addita]|uniref:Uncharacterized protein n=1 Tax=Aquimarina addita TaxID=870485 RepID=A0ABP6UZ98_9FLAO
MNVDISNMTSSELKNLASDITQNSSQYTKSNLDNFAFTIQRQIINAKGEKEYYT